MNTQHERNATHDGHAARGMPSVPPSAMARAGVLIAMIAAASVAVASLPGPEREPVPVPKIKEPKPKPLPAPAAPTPERGRLLYENHCTECHESVVHVRERRRAGSLATLEGWVRHWSKELNLNGGDAEVSTVVEYLDRRFYKFDHQR